MSWFCGFVVLVGCVFVVFVCLLAVVCVLPLCLLVLWVSCWWSTCSAAVAGFVRLCVCWFCVFVVLVGCVFVVFVCLLALVCALPLCLLALWVSCWLSTCSAAAVARFVGLCVCWFCGFAVFVSCVLVVLWVRCFCCFCWAVKWKAKKERNCAGGSMKKRWVLLAMPPLQNVGAVDWSWCASVLGS